MSKVVFLKLVPQSFAKSDGPLSSELLDSVARGRSALVIERTPDDLLAIQGYPPVPCKDKHECWLLFRNAARNLLGIVQSSAISIRFADPPFTAVSNIAAILREPSHIVNVIVSCLENLVSTVPVEAATQRWGLHREEKVDPYCKYREFYQNRSQTGSGHVRNKCNFEEMNKLISQLSEVSMSLQRTQHECDEIAKRCSSSKRKIATRPEVVDHEVLAEDSNVEKLLHVAESLTAHIIMQQSKQNKEGSPSLPATVPEEPSILPMCPSDICVRPSFSGGVYVMWNPVRLDAKDENRGHKVLGYMVYCDGALKVQVEGALTSQVEIHMLEGAKEYHIQVCTHTELCNSPLSTAVKYRHAHPKNYSLPPSNTSQLAKNRKSAKVESWLKTSRLDSGIDSTGGNDDDVRDYHVHFAEDATNITQEGTDLDDSKSTTSSHTSGIVTDMPPVSPKLHPACPCNSCTTCGNSPSRSSSNLCYCSSPAFSNFSADNAFDTVIDEPVVLEPVNKVSLPPVMNVYTTHSLKRVAPPQNVTVQATRSGHIRVSWTPIRRDFRGCCNGCFVLGYRIYVNDTSHLSVDGPTTYEAHLQCPPQTAPPQHRLLIHVRTRSISSESDPSNIVLYDTLVHRTVEASARVKLDSALSSSASLCMAEPLQIPQRRMSRGVTRTHPGRSVETYV